MTESRPWLKHYPASVRTSLEYVGRTVHSLLDEAADAHPSLTCCVFYKERHSFGAVREQANRVANALIRQGVKKGDRVALMAPNCPQYLSAYYGILKAGGVVAQINSIYVEREIRQLVENAGAKVILTVDLFYPRIKNILGTCGLETVIVAGLHGEIPLGADAIRFEDWIAHLPATAPELPFNPREDIAVLQYTGGTTGVSKGAMLTHFNLVANVMQIREWFGSMPPGTERIMSIMPFFHSYGMTCCMNFAVAGAQQMIILPRFEIQECLDAVKEHQPTSFPGVPTIYVAINNHPRATSYGISSIRYCNSGAAPLPVEVLKEFEAKTGATISEGYGLSEASPVTHSNPLTGIRKVGSIGIPIPDTDCRIVDPETGADLPVGQVGELLIRGPQIMKGYWNMPAETERALKDGWLHTGDLVRMDEDGYFYVVDRLKDMIIAGGYNIYPRDIEEVLYQHPDVEECVVAGVPDAYRGETVKAYVVLKEKAKVTVAELDRHCRANLAAFKVPKLYELRKGLPKSAVGKILRKNLVEQEKRRLGTHLSIGDRAGQPQEPLKPVLSVEEITVHHGPVKVLNQVSLEVLPGELVSLVGANGAGKTTVLKTIAGTLEPEEGGRILFMGEEVQGRPAYELARKGLVMVPEGRQIFANLSTWENLTIGAFPKLFSRNRREVQELAESIADRFPILKRRRLQPAGTLSGGEQQMLAIARALMAQPKLLMLDEPSLGLAPAIVNQLFQIIQDLRAEGTTILLVEQKAFRAMEISDWAYVLETGRISVSGAARDVMQNPDVARVYLGHTGHAAVS